MTYKWIAFFATAIILFSCQPGSAPDNKNPADSNNSAAIKTDDAGDKNLSANQGIFSYTIEGKQVVAKNYVQHANLFINEVSNDAANGMVIIKVTTNSSNVFHFQVANSGSASITNYKPSLGRFGDKKEKVATYMDGKTYRNFYAVSATVTIINIDATRVSGKFSGKFIEDKNDGGASVEITDGSFNLPFVEH
ncbi:MAG: hypothetical protein JST47_10400 [Bacteroidetes bacterium]|nr:hypothetical protein [Bacteroidota bacterium]MBS1975071.1 hypothetical protein [Bacteroidota bacterium]